MIVRNYFIGEFIRVRRVFVVTASVLSFAACGGGDSQEETAPAPDTATAVREAVVPARIDRTQLAQLRWLEGTWRGTGDDTPTFFERYSFPTDSTMVAVSYRDSTMTSVADSSIYTIGAGQLTNDGNGPQWVLAAFSTDSLRFEPLARASNSFTWRRVSADEWIAVLGPPASGGDSAPSRQFVMRRVR